MNNHFQYLQQKVSLKHSIASNDGNVNKITQIFNGSAHAAMILKTIHVLELYYFSTNSLCDFSLTWQLAVLSVLVLVSGDEEHEITAINYFNSKH